MIVMKKILAFVCMLCLLLTLSGCFDFGDADLGDALDKAGELKDKADEVNEDIAGKVISILSDQAQDDEDSSEEEE